MHRGQAFFSRDFSAGRDRELEPELELVPVAILLLTLQVIRMCAQFCSCNFEELVQPKKLVTINTA